jgi:hypothetical protein
MAEGPHTDELAPVPPAQSEPEHISARKKLGIGKAEVALGYSAKDAGLTFFGGTALLTLVIQFGRNRVKPITQLADFFDKSFTYIRNKMGEGDWGLSLGSAAAIVFPLSHLANLPALVYAPKLVEDAENRYNDEIHDNARLTRDNTRLRGIYNEETSLNASLKQQNEQLREDNNKFQAIIAGNPLVASDYAHAGAGASFAERLQAPSHSTDLTP